MLKADYSPLNPTRRSNIPLFIHKLLIIQDNRPMLLAACAGCLVVGLCGTCKRRDGLCKHQKRGSTCHHSFPKVPHLSCLHNQIRPFYNSSFVFLCRADPGSRPAAVLFFGTSAAIHRPGASTLLPRRRSPRSAPHPPANPASESNTQIPAALPPGDMTAPPHARLTSRQTPGCPGIAAADPAWSNGQPAAPRQAVRLTLLLLQLVHQAIQ